MSILEVIYYVVINIKFTIYRFTEKRKVKAVFYLLLFTQEWERRNSIILLIRYRTCKEFLNKMQMLAGLFSSWMFTYICKDGFGLLTDYTLNNYFHSYLYFLLIHLSRFLLRWTDTPYSAGVRIRQLYKNFFTAADTTLEVFYSITKLELHQDLQPVSPFFLFNKFPPSILPVFF